MPKFSGVVVATSRYLCCPWSLPGTLCALGGRLWAPFFPSVVASGRPVCPRCSLQGALVPLAVASVRRSCRRRSLPGAISLIGNRLQVPFVPSVVASLRHVRRRWSLPCAMCALDHRVWAPFLPSVVACGRPCSPKQRLPSVNGETRAAAEHARDSKGAPSAVTTVEVG